MPGNLTEVYLQNEFACLHRPVSLPRPKIQILKIITLKPSAWLSKAPQSSFPFWLGSLGAQLSKFQGAPDIQTQPPSWCMSVAPIHQVFCLSPPIAARTLNRYSRNCLLQSTHRWWGTWRSCPSPPGRWARPGRSSGSSSTASRQTSPCHTRPRDQQRSRSWQYS